jgi:hypothetical protein
LIQHKKINSHENHWPIKILGSNPAETGNWPIENLFSSKWSGRDLKRETLMGGQKTLQSTLFKFDLLYLKLSAIASNRQKYQIRSQ